VLIFNNGNRNPDWVVLSEVLWIETGEWDRASEAERMM
jgi:hypothetical protein